MCRIMLRLVFFLYSILFSTSVFSKEIPVIVISAGKTPQSYSSVGSQVTIIDSETIENSSDSFLTDLLSAEVQGLNIFPVRWKRNKCWYSIERLTKTLLNCLYRWSKNE